MEEKLAIFVERNGDVHQVLITEEQNEKLINMIKETSEVKDLIISPDPIPGVKFRKL